ncbi:MAG: sodium:solute symporter family protein [Desulfarculaceae bacterium]|nr:sodium:solute symporter family protein [Desulfarculaceae bacterium]MCF8049367.1 sodium:solute symporter family protein [Desulfarculaceae bacterium]MCF8065480.1 sodium:solute symporter family protein [Desulfarculaceae bacterium]MCF8099291.1 sodium:solute symporter family protein [Desulfarculaceae bacterium]
MSKSNLPLYWAYLAAYLAVMFGVGIYHARKIKTMEQFLVADRNVGFWRIVGTTVATACGAAAFIGFVGLGYKTGVFGIFFWLIPYVFFGLVIALVFGRVIRRLNLYTIPDAFALRFGRSAAMVPSIIQIVVYSIPTLAIQFIGMGTVFATFFGLELHLAILLSFAIIFGYTILGGMPATILTDSIQSMVLTVGLLILLFLGIHYAGGVSRVLAITPAQYWKPMGPATLGGFLSLALTVGPFYLVWQATWQRFYASKNQKVAVWGTSLGTVLTGALLSLSFLIGIIARGYLPHDLRPDLVFTEAIFTVFPAALGGLVIVGLFAALMSGGDSFIMMGSASLARDVYQQFINPKASPQRMLVVSRWSVVLLSLAALSVALLGTGIVPIYLLVVKTAGAAVVFPFLALMFWPRATRKGIVASMIAGGAVTICWHLAGNPYVMGAVPGYLSSLAVLVVTSLLTRHSPGEQVKAAYFHPLEKA